MNRATLECWTGTPLQNAARAFSSPGAPSTMASSGGLQAAIGEIVEKRPPGGFA